MADTPSFVNVEMLDGGAIWHVTFGGSKGNILDSAMVAELTAVFHEAAAARDLKAIVLEGKGHHFSFGASVLEHLPGHEARMLRGFHDMFRALFGASVVTIAAVRGACLGGGLELAAACHRVYATAEAQLGQPEVVLGVFAPVASLLLSERIGRAHAEDLLLSGRTIDGASALKVGLVDGVGNDPLAHALEYAREMLLDHSASSLRYAVRASRHGLTERFRAEIRELERMYLDELMKTADAVEGLKAFLEKRKPAWTNA